jgi:hypothetical protein
VHPYRYAHAQKDEMECQCDDMLRLHHMLELFCVLLKGPCDA